MELLQYYREKFNLFPWLKITRNNYKLFTDWFAGLSAGFVSVTVCAPLDLARTRQMLIATTKSSGTIAYKGFFQTIDRIYKDESLRGFYKGYNVTAISIPLFHSLYFSFFYKTNNYLQQHYFPESQIVLSNISAAIFTGFICNTVTNPLWVVRTRIQSQYLHQESGIKYKGLFSGISKIFKEEGFRALYKGLGASYIGLSHPAILYPLYEHIKRYLRRTKGEVTHIDHFLASLFSKFVAMVITFPHVVLRARLQDNRTPNKLMSSESSYRV